MDSADPQWTFERGTETFDPPADYALVPPTVAANPLATQSWEQQTDATRMPYDTADHRAPLLALEPPVDKYRPLTHDDDDFPPILPSLGSATNVNLERESRSGSASWAPALGERAPSMWPLGNSSGGPIPDGRSDEGQQASASPSRPPVQPSLSAVVAPLTNQLSDNIVGPQQQPPPRAECGTCWPPGGEIQGSLDEIASTLSKVQGTLRQTRLYQGGTDTILEDEIGRSLALLNSVGASIGQLRACIPAKSETACTACKNLKRRCDRSLPICGPCRRVSRVCSYPNEGVTALRKRAPGGTPDA